MQPYIQPYYDTYAAPYVHAVHPYTDTFRSRLYEPGQAFASGTYNKYAAPRLAELQNYGSKKWEATVKPNLDNVQKQATLQYEKTLSPHVKSAGEALNPYVSQTNDLINDQYQRARPHALRALHHTQRFTVQVALPYTLKTTNALWTFVKRRAWPPIKILYGQNVQPQLFKIRERLASYRDVKGLEAMVDAISSSSSLDSIALKTTVSGTVYSSTVTQSSSSASSTTLTDSQASKAAEQRVIDDLEIWQTKFAKAADKGADDLQDRVSDITTRQIRSQVQGTGETLVVALEETISSSLTYLKNSIIDIVKTTISDDPDDEEDELVKEQARTAIRATGQRIKEAAQRLRSWRQRYDIETSSLVSSASESTLDVIDNIRDLGLQEIGLRWASMEGVTHKDWTEYHNLKKTFDDWRIKVQSVAIDHSGLAQAKEAGEAVEAKGMAIAQDAAKELSRLKDVAVWKLQARDDSDDFSTKQLPIQAVKAAKEIKSKLSDLSGSVIGTSQGTMESIASMVSENIADAASTASSLAAPASSAISDGNSKVVSHAASAGLHFSDGASSAYSAVVSSASNVADSDASDISFAASSVSSAAAEQVVAGPDALANSASFMSSKVSSKVASPPNVPDSASSAASEVSASIGSKSSSLNPIASSSVSSVSSKAYSSAKPVVSAAEEIPESVSSAAADVSSLISSKTSSVSSYASSLMYEAADIPVQARKAQKILANSARSASSVASSATSSLMRRASGTVGPSEFNENNIQDGTKSAKASVSSIVAAVPDAAHGVSLSVQSVISAAGESYADVTSSLSSSVIGTSSESSRQKITSTVLVEEADEV